jgi:hypothetical protein
MCPGILCVCGPPFQVQEKFLNLLTRRLLGMLLQGVCRVRAQSSLGVIASLLRALGRCTALVVDVAGGGARLSLVLPLGLGGLAAGVGSGHIDVY